MCLDITKESKRTKAETDIICFKYVMRLGNLITPYRKVVVNIGSTYESRLFKNYCSSAVNVGLHSVCFVDELYRICLNNSMYIPIKCCIPKGSWYYEGKFGVYKGYASTKLQYLEILDMSELKKLIGFLEELH